MTTEEVLVENEVISKKEVSAFNLIIRRDAHVLLQKLIKKSMIDFAKFHVQKALEAASENATMKVEYDDEAYQESNEYGQSYVSAHEVERGGEYGGITIEAESILTSYSLDNIV